MNKTAAALSFAALPVLYSCAAWRGRPRLSAQPLAATARWQGSFCPVAKPEEELVTNAGAWSALWRKIGQPAPHADMSRNFAAAVFLGTRPTGGYGIVFLPPSVEQGALVISYSVKKPLGMTFEALTQPYAVELYPKTELPVRLEAAAAEKTGAPR
ncbi:MAG: protease complex subunit PrcB family protein [Elusimicrobia bacterium]|nr:protease complex subunit PrcB family protein [Elusimicrobiota bacterium]